MDLEASLLANPTGTANMRFRFRRIQTSGLHVTKMSARLRALKAMTVRRTMPVATGIVDHSDSAKVLHLISALHSKPIISVETPL